MEENHQDQFTVAGTNINEVKKQNAQSGLTFNELNKLFDKKPGKSSSGIQEGTNEKTH